MAIKIKRSTGNTAPAELAAGQLAYVEGATNGGTLYYGEIGGTVREIAGRKYVDKLNGIEAGAQVNTVTSVAGRTGAVTITASDLSDFNSSVDARITSTAVTTALGYQPLDPAEKGANNGIATLDASGLVPSTQLPSYVDDVLEYANLAAFPATGESAKIYVAIDTAKTYRWSGSVYVEISASPGSTDSVTEGSTNLYYTDARARAAISVTQNLTYDNATGIITGPNLSSYLTTESDPVFTASPAGAITSTQVTNWDTAYGWGNHATAGYIDQVSNDPAPQLGGDLDVSNRSIVSINNGNIVFAPNGTGEVIIKSAVTDFGPDSGNATVGSQAGNLTIQGQNTATPGGVITLTGGTNGGISISPAGTGTLTIGKSTTISSGSLTVSSGGVIAGSMSIITNTYTTASSFTMGQSHNTADCNNFTLLRSRGTWTSQSAVQSGDELAEFGVAANDGSSVTVAGQKLAWGFNTIMTGAPSTDLLPHRTDWQVNTTAGATAVYMSIANDAIVRVREIGAVAGVTNLNISAGTDGNIVLAPNGTGRVVLDGMSWPAADGTNGYVLTTNGSGDLSWAAQTAGVTAFTGLTDVPASFSGSAGYYVKVNSGATALEFSQDVDDGTF